MPLEEVDTPALLVDLDVLERHLRRMADSLRGLPVRLRPHAKSHKCPEIARRRMALGAVGVCCQKVSEAEALVEGGIVDVLVSNEVVGRRKLERIAALARRARVAVCVDDAGNVDELDAAARRAAIDAAVGHVQATVGLLENHGIPCPWVTGGGTGTYLLEAASGAYRKVQP